MFATKKQLAVFLSSLKAFPHPQPSLEQYTTEGEIAAALLWDAHMHRDIEGKRIADLGAGTGILGIGALALGAAHATFVEIDAHALPTLKENLAELENRLPCKNKWTIAHVDARAHGIPADTVVMNAPFGTRERGADAAFLRSALAIAPTTYSLHKASTTAYLRKLIERCGGAVTDERRYALALKNTMAHHTRRIVRIETACLRIARA